MILSLDNNKIQYM